MAATSPVHVELSRDLAAAQVAYAAGDVEASRAAHQNPFGNVAKSDEKHAGAGSEFVRSIVFGAMDGILTSFGIVASIYGSSLAAQVVILLGFSNVIADGVAMGVGDTLSTKAENDHVLAERKREEWEYDNYREGEVKEMVQLYMSKGFSEEDATRIMTIMSKPAYKDFFIDHMMMQELGQEVPDADDSPLKAGIAMFCSFLFFGAIPLFPYVGFYVGKYHSPGGQFGICCAATVVALALLGAMQARFTGQSKLASMASMIFVGSLTAGAAYLVGWGLNVALGASDSLCPSRDLEGAKRAYAADDVAASKAAHDAVVLIDSSVEKHGQAGSEFLRSLVFGAMDGIMTTFAHVSAVAGSNISAKVVIVLAFSNLIADAIAMGVGDYISTIAEQKHIMAERKREEWEYDNFPEGEVTEMVELYVQKGFEEADAREILSIMAKPAYKDFFIDHMMIEELGKPVPDEDPLKAGLAMFFSFIIFGSLPVWTYVILNGAGYNHSGGQFGASCAMTAVALFLLGVVQSKFTEQNKLWGGMLMTFQGSLTAGAAYLIGWGLSQALHTC